MALAQWISLKLGTQLLSAWKTFARIDDIHGILERM